MDDGFFDVSVYKAKTEFGDIQTRKDWMRDDEITVTFYRDRELQYWKSHDFDNGGRDQKHVWGEETDFIRMEFLRSGVGKQLTVIERPATDEDKRRFQAHWNAYQRGLPLMEKGHPLVQNEWFTGGDIKALKEHGFKTFEHVAKMPDGCYFFGSQGLKMKAQQFIDAISQQVTPEALLERFEAQQRSMQEDRAALESEKQIILEANKSMSAELEEVRRQLEEMKRGKNGNSR